MIEPTDDMRSAFRKAQHQRARQIVDDARQVLDQGALVGAHDALLDAGLAAVLALVERDYDVRKTCAAELTPGVRCKLPENHMVAEHEGLTSTGNRIKWAELP